MAKRVKTCPAWLATFADLMSLLMAFFVLLYAMSTLEIPKYQAVVESFNQALGQGGELSKEQEAFFESIMVQDPLEEVVSTPFESSQIESLKPLFESLIETFPQNRDSLDSVNIEYDSETDTIKITFPEQITFDTGRADLKPEFSQILTSFDDFRQPGIQVKVIGHTDKQPLMGGRFVSNWALSSARASSVIVELLNQNLVTENQVQAIGVADTQPLVEEDSLEAFAKNRRVEVVVTAKE